MRETNCEEKSNQSQVQPTLNLLMITTSSYSGSLQSAITFVMGVNSGHMLIHTDLLHLVFLVVLDSY